MKNNPTKQLDLSINNKRHYQKYWLLLAIIPLYILFKNLQEFAVNLPNMDDYDSILNFIAEWKNGSASQKFFLLFKQHNEHRIFSSRLIYVLCYLITGGINFITLIYIANLHLLLIAGVLIYFTFKILKKHWELVTILIAMCVFDLSSYENSNFAMSGMANYGVITFFLLSLFCYSKKNRLWLIPAVLLHFVCTFSGGSGMIGGLGLLVFILLSEKDKMKTIVVILANLIFDVLYFVGFVKVDNGLKGKNWSDMFNFFMKLSAAHFDYDNRFTIAIFLILVLCIAVFLTWKKNKSIKTDVAAFVGVLFFLLTTIASISVFRSGGKEGIDHDSYASRYLILSHLLAISVFIILFHAIQSEKIKWVVFGVFALISIKSYQLNYQYGLDGFERTHDRLIRVKYYYPDEKVAKKIATDVCNKNIYCIEKNREENQ